MTKKRPQCIYVDLHTGESCERLAPMDEVLCLKHKSEAKKNPSIAFSNWAEEFITPEPGNSPLLNPIAALEWEYARTIGRIKFYDARLAALREERELWWGKTREESITASEYTGLNTTYEARENMILTLQGEERTRLERLTKLWIDTKFEAARLEVAGVFAGSVNRAVRKVLEALNVDEQDAEIRRTVAAAIRSARTAEPLSLDAVHT
jgi:hypothetical protein